MNTKQKQNGTEDYAAKEDVGSAVLFDGEREEYGAAMPAEPGGGVTDGALLPDSERLVLDAYETETEEGCVRYVLFACDGADRAEFGTACTVYYGIALFRADGEQVLLPDIAREEEAARSLFAQFSKSATPLCAAVEVMDALLG